jgi:hypothetical protein
VPHILAEPETLYPRPGRWFICPGIHPGAVAESDMGACVSDRVSCTVCSGAQCHACRNARAFKDATESRCHRSGAILWTALHALGRVQHSRIRVLVLLITTGFRTSGF